MGNKSRYVKFDGILNNNISSLTKENEFFSISFGDLRNGHTSFPYVVRYADIDVRQNYRGSLEQIMFLSYKAKYDLLRISCLSSISYVVVLQLT